MPAARSKVADSLARESLEDGGDLTATFIRTFGHPPNSPVGKNSGAKGASEGQGAAGDISTAAAEGALEQWHHGAANAVHLQQAAAEAVGRALGVETSALSLYTVHSDGRSEAAASPCHRQLQFL